jgi:hypothetical protein
VARNTVEGVRFTIATIVHSVLVAGWHCESPTKKKDKENLRQLKLREEQDRIIRIIKGRKK